MKQVFIFLFFSACMFGASAQDSIRVNLLNQYKQQVADATIDVNNVIYTSGKDGSVSILAAGNDSITITKEGYSVQRASVNEIRQGKFRSIIV